eukprot:TRINITY_DN1437_c0_g1_i1.p1 TRINITY_DN1437_c0_g1~~TRINITY_DN1437_c0_g1_i1.p1  ORF type:complete len:361 (-),score=109.25 TRINITY_DN1437_c0_g1_i1:62-1144(-)
MMFRATTRIPQRWRTAFQNASDLRSLQRRHSSSISIVDLKDLQAVRQAASSCGFFYVRSAHIDQAHIDSYLDAAAWLFSLEPQFKRACASSAANAKGWYSYDGVAVGELSRAPIEAYLMGDEAPAELRTDYFGRLGYGRDDMAWRRMPMHQRNRWPQAGPESAAFRATVVDGFKRLLATADDVLAALAAAIDRPPHELVRLHDKHDSHLELKCYAAPQPEPPTSRDRRWQQLLPNVSQPAAVDDTADDLRTVRLKAHTDLSSVTLLLQSAGHEVLQVLGADGRWQPVPYVDAAVLVNCGDVLERWSGGLCKSSLHRVVDVPPARGSRYSIVLFAFPNHEAVVQTEADGRETLFGDLMPVQ